MSTDQKGRSLDSRIRAVWRRAQKLHFAVGCIAIARWGIPLFLIAIIVDRLVYFPLWARAAILALIVSVSLYRAWRCGWRWMRAFNATRIALQIEGKEGGLQSLLVTAVQLREDSAPGTSSALSEKTCRIAEERATTLRPKTTVSYQALRRPGIVALVLVVVVAGLSLLDGPFVKAGLQRIFAPWRPVEYPTDTHLDLGNADLVVRHGDEVVVKVRVSGVIPSEAKLSLRTGSGRPRVRMLAVTNGVCSYNIASASRDFTYRIHAGDARSKWHSVTVVPAPRIKKVNATLNYPAYLQKPPETASGLTMTVPEDTQIHWTLTMDSPLRKANLLCDGRAPLPLAISDNGLEVMLTETAKESRGYHFTWAERAHGFKFSSPRHYLQVAPDQPPRVELTQPAANLHAILGRAVEFKVRARDDHGIAAAGMSYQVDLRPKKTEVLTTPIENGSGDQALDWDYRASVTNLQIGDTVAFSVEVRDRYAGPGGPHIARSDTRRITFLSREDYLAEIAKRKGRLLSRVRGIYRQERAAHELVLKLDPDDDAYKQTVQLESARQEMLRGQINEAVGEVQDLIDDLAANGVSDAPEGAMLDELRVRLGKIAETRVVNAADLLREQGNPLNEGIERDTRPAARAIDVAARELARLVLQRDIDSALEVFAREIRAIAQNGTECRRSAVTYMSAPAGDGRNAALTALAKEERELAEWTRTLFLDLEKGMRYTKRPLAVLSLTRRIKDLRRQGVDEAMEDTAALLGKGRVAEAMERQWAPIHALLQAEFSVRSGIEYRTLLTARDRLSVIERELEDIVAKNKAGSSDGRPPSRELVQRMAMLREELAGILLPEIPAPHAKLFDIKPPRKPEVEQLLRKALQAMSVPEGERDAIRLVVELLKIVSDRAEESLVETAGVGKVAAVVGEWAMRIADFETRQVGLLEETDIAAADGKPCAPFVAEQQTIANDLANFQKDIRRENRDIDLPECDLAPILGRLDRARESMNHVLKPMKENKGDLAIEGQEAAADMLTYILRHAESHGERFAMLESLLGLERSVRKASRYVADIAEEQRDLIAVIDKGDPDQLVSILPIQENLCKCVVDVAPLLDFVAGQLAVGTPLVFARADMEDAVASLKARDRADALDALDVASESLETVTARMLKMSRQVGYVAEIVDYLNVAFGDISFAAFQQEQLRHTIKDDKVTIPDGFPADQRAMVQRVKLLDQQLAFVVGPLTNLVAAVPPVEAAVISLEQGARASARQKMTDAVEALDHNAAGLLVLIEALRGLPQVRITSEASDSERLLMRVLAVASDQQVLFRATQAADEKAIGTLAERQLKIAESGRSLVSGGNPDPKLVSARQSLAKAATLLKTSSRAGALEAQESASTELRHFILGQALLLDTSLPGAAPSDPDAPPGEGDRTGTDLAVVMGDVGAFVSGEIPKNKNAEWQILKERGRAALHENFARELPLEYRGMLKSYFERVAK